MKQPFSLLRAVRPVRLFVMRARAFCLAFSLIMGLSLTPQTTQAATGTPVVVNETTREVPDTTGTTIATSASGSNAIHVYNRGTLSGPNGWVLSSTAGNAPVIRVEGSSSLSGSNLLITSFGGTSHGVYATGSSAAFLTGGTITTKGHFSAGIYSEDKSFVSGSDLYISTSGSRSHAVYTTKGGSAIITGGTFSVNGDYSTGLYTDTQSFVSATNLYITTNGYAGHGVYATTGGTVVFAGGTITTSGSTSCGLYADNNALVTATNIYITTTEWLSYGAIANDSGTLSFTGGTVTTNGSSAHGVAAINNGFLSGTDLIIETTGTVAQGAYATNTGTLFLDKSHITTNGSDGSGLRANRFGFMTVTSSTIEAKDGNAFGAYASSNGTINVVNSKLTSGSDLVRCGDDATAAGGNNTVTLDTVITSNSGNVFSGEGPGSVSTLTVKSSDLTGNIVTNGSSTNHVYLQNSTTLAGHMISNGTSVQNIYLQTNSQITGSSNRLDTSKLNISLDAVNTQWQVTGNSTLTNLTNSGTVNMSTGDNSRRTMTLNGDFTQQASGLIAMSLSGTGGLANSLVIVESTGSTTVAGGLNLLGDISAINNINNGHFVLFDDQGLSLVSGTFANIKLNGITVSLSNLDGTQNGGIFNVNGTDYVFTYAGIAETGDYTGGNDIMITLLNQPVPEPGTWVMMLSGTGILVCYLRARQHSRRRES